MEESHRLKELKKRGDEYRESKQFRIEDVHFYLDTSITDLIRNAWVAGYLTGWGESQEMKDQKPKG